MLPKLFPIALQVSERTACSAAMFTEAPEVN